MLKIIRLIIYVGIAAFLIALSVLLSVRNSELVSFDLIVYRFPEVRSGVFFLSTLILGLIIGYLIAFPKIVYYKYMSKKKV